MKTSMLNDNEATFRSKILLFGEYAIIQDSMGLSVPYDSYEGKLTFEKEVDDEVIKESNKELRKYYNFLKKLQDNGELLAELDLKRLNADMKKGLFFDSSIPQGYGVGSSGAIVAAIYDKYAVSRISSDNITSKKLIELKKIFGQMESYHHGKSSGMDPLICYLNLPVLIQSKGSIGTVDLPKLKKQGPGAIFLLNTGAPGKTQPLVELFMDKCTQHEFLDLMRENFIPYNDNSIKAFLKGETKTLFHNLYFLSKFLLDNLSPMIPQFVHDIWKKGLDSGTYYLKLCGSGGGGFILGFTEDFEKTQKLLKDHDLQVIRRF